MAAFDEVTILPSAARTALVAVQAQQIPRGAKIAAYVIDWTVNPVSAGLTFTVQLFNKTSNSWVDILSSATLVAIGTTVLRVGPYITSVANLAAPCPLPFDGQIGIKVAVADADSATYSVSLMFG